MDTLNALGCQGEIAKYDTSQSMWMCAVDDNTFLDANGVLGYVMVPKSTWELALLSMVQICWLTHTPHTSQAI